MAVGGGDRGRVAGIALGSMVQVGWFIKVFPLGMQEYIHIGEITIETICGVNIDGIIAVYLIMSFVVIGKVGTTQGIGETTETGVLKADTAADVMGDKTKWSVVTRDRTNVVTRDKTKWSVVIRNRTNVVTRDKTKWSVVIRNRTNVVTRDKTKWSVVTRNRTNVVTRDKTKWNVVTRNKTRDKIDKVREWSDIKVVLNSNLLLVVTEINVIRTT